MANVTTDAAAVGAATAGPACRTEVVIRATGRPGRGSSGREVALLSIQCREGTVGHPWDDLDYGPSWMCYEYPVGTAGQCLLSRGRGATLRLPADGIEKLSFLKHPWGGVVEVCWSGQARCIDLCASPAGAVDVSLEGGRIHEDHRDPGIRVANRWLAEYEAAKGFPRVRSAPADITLRTINTCNVRCIFCFRMAYPNVPAEVMRLDAFRRMVDMLPMDTAWNFDVSGSGDFSVHPEAGEFLHYLHDTQHGLRVRISTNGNRISERLWDALEGTPDLAKTIHVSLNAATAPTYGAITQGGDFGQVIANVERMRQIESIDLSTSMVVMQQNLEEVPAFADLSRRLGMAHVRYYAMMPTRVFGIENSPMRGDTAQRCLDLLAEAERRARDAGLQFGARGFVDQSKHPDAAYQAARWRDDPQAWLLDKLDRAGRCRLPEFMRAPIRACAPLYALALAGRGRMPEHRKGTASATWLEPCTAPWRLLNVTPEGEVTFCCGDAPPAGRLSEHHWRDVWNSPLVVMYRRRANSLFPPGPCRWCRNVGRMKQLSAEGL